MRILLSLILLIVPSIVYPYYSIEILTVRAESIGLYDYPDSALGKPIPLRVSLKGNPPGTLDATQEFVRSGHTPKPGTPVLVFANVWGDEETFVWNMETSDYFIGLSAKGRKVFSPDSVLLLVRETLSALDERPKYLKENCLNTELAFPAKSEWGLVAALRSPHLGVPLTRKHRDKLLLMTEMDTTLGYSVPHFGLEAQRFMAARLLCRCFKVDMLPVLEDMLDSEWARAHNDTMIFPARQFAFDTLNALGQEMDFPPGYLLDVSARDEYVFDWMFAPVTWMGYIDVRYLTE